MEEKREVFKAISESKLLINELIKLIKFKKKRKIRLTTKKAIEKRSESEKSIFKKRAFCKKAAVKKVEKKV